MIKNNIFVFVLSLGVYIFSHCGNVMAEDRNQPTQESDSELAMKLQNPVANLISVPMQSNWDFGIGPKDSTRYLLNVQPVIPVSISDDYNLIIRTIMPFIDAEAPTDESHDLTGLGDITQSFFFSPKEPVDGWIVGFGPALLFPSATNNSLGSEKWGAGPTAVLLKQVGGWTYGMLGNQIWSYAGDDDRDDVSSTFLQPFGSYTTKMHTSFVLNTESSYDWENTQWTVPLNLMVAQLLKVGSQPIQIQLGARTYTQRPDGGPDWGLRAALVLLFPK